MVETRLAATSPKDSTEVRLLRDAVGDLEHALRTVEGLVAEPEEDRIAKLAEPDGGDDDGGVTDNVAAQAAGGGKT